MGKFSSTVTTNSIRLVSMVESFDHVVAGSIGVVEVWSSLLLLGRSGSTEPETEASTSDSWIFAARLASRGLSVDSEGVLGSSVVGES